MYVLSSSKPFIRRNSHSEKNSERYVYLLYCVCLDILTLDAGLLARSQYSEGPATGHLDTGFS